MILFIPERYKYNENITFLLANLLFIKSKKILSISY